MTDGGHSRIVSVENPKLDILNIEYSEPGLLLYICRDQIQRHVLDVNTNLNLFVQFLTYQYHPDFVIYFCSMSH